MSWSDDIRCLYCDARLPLYRKITHGQFCSSSHRKAYWQEQERLAVERLHQTHDSLQIRRPRNVATSASGVRASAEPQMRGVIPERLILQLVCEPQVLAIDPYPFEIGVDHPLTGCVNHWIPLRLTP